MSARPDATYRVNKIAWRTAKNLSKPSRFNKRTLDNRRFVHPSEQHGWLRTSTVPVRADGYRSPRSVLRREGCTTDRHGQKHFNLRENARRLAQMNRTAT